MQGEGGLPPRPGQGAPAQEPRKRQRSTLAGRFSGRLARKEDEAQLVVECALLGPLLGDTQPATLSTIVRSIASGRVRKYLEAHLPRGGAGGAQGGDAAADLQAAWQSRAALAAAEHQNQQLLQAQAELNALKARLWDSAARNAELEKQGAIQQRMLQMLTGGSGTPPASLAEAAAADVAAAVQQQQAQQQQQPAVPQPSLPPATQQQLGGGGGGGGFAHAPSSGFSELMAPSQWGSGTGGAPVNPVAAAAVAAAAAAPRPALPGALAGGLGGAAGGLLAPAVTAGALAGMGPFQQLRFGSGGDLLAGSNGGNAAGQHLPAFSTAAPATAAGQGGSSGFQRPKSGDGWAPMRPSNGGSAFTAPAAGSAFSPHAPRSNPATPTAARPGPGTLLRAASGGNGGLKPEHPAGGGSGSGGDAIAGHGQVGTGTLQEGETGHTAPQDATTTGDAAAAEGAAALPLHAEAVAAQQNQHAMEVGTDAVANAAAAPEQQQS